MAGSKPVIQPAACYAPLNTAHGFAPGLFRMTRRAQPLEIIEFIATAFGSRDDMVQLQAGVAYHWFGTTLGTPVRKVPFR